MCPVSVFSIDEECREVRQKLTGQTKYPFFFFGKAAFRLPAEVRGRILTTAVEAPFALEFLTNKFLQVRCRGSTAWIHSECPQLMNLTGKAQLVCMFLVTGSTVAAGVALNQLKLVAPKIKYCLFFRVNLLLISGTYESFTSKVM